MRISPHLFAAIALPLCFGQGASAPTRNDVSTELRIAGEVATPLTLSPNELKNMPRQTLKVVNPHEKREEIYEGVAVQELLRRAGVPQNEKLRGSAMAMFVVAEASDGYRVVYSLAELDSDFQDSGVIRTRARSQPDKPERKGEFT